MPVCLYSVYIRRERGQKLDVNVLKHFWCFPTMRWRLTFTLRWCHISQKRSKTNCSHLLDTGTHPHTHAPVSMWWRCGKTFVVVTLFACSISCVCVFIYEWNFSIFVVCVGGRRDTLKSESEFGIQIQIDFMFTYLENTHGSLLLMCTLALWFLLYLPALTGYFTCTRSYLRPTNTMHYI